MEVLQVFIFAFGVPATYLVSRKDKYKKYGYVFGLCAQPFWIISTLRGEQYGMLLLCIAYTISWANGIWNYWIKKQKYQKNEN